MKQSIGRDKGNLWMMSCGTPFPDWNQWGETSSFFPEYDPKFLAPLTESTVPALLSFLSTLFSFVDIQNFTFLKWVRRLLTDQASVLQPTGSQRSRMEARCELQCLHSSTSASFRLPWRLPPHEVNRSTCVPLRPNTVTPQNSTEDPVMGVKIIPAFLRHTCSETSEQSNQETNFLNGLCLTDHFQTRTAHF